MTETEYNIHDTVPVQEVDVVAYCVYSGHPICHVDLEDDRVRFYLPAAAVDSCKSHIATGQAHIDLARWQSVLRQIRRDYLSTEGKQRIRVNCEMREGIGNDK